MADEKTAEQPVPGLPCDTVKVADAEVQGLGFRIINKSDFDPKTHKVFKEAEK